MSDSRERSAGLDAVKGAACVLIVWHHLAFYGPMSDVVHAWAPAPMDWLYDYARMAVQVFLVLAGFLAAGALAPQGEYLAPSAFRLIARRYLRLLPPYLVAVAVSVLVAALVRPWFVHDSVSAAPTLWQLVAHALLLQDVLGYDALSAGVWYVAIDVQLFALSVLMFSASRAAPRGESAALGLALVTVMTAVSLLHFNRQSWADVTALYFFGAYGLGMLAFWASAPSHRVPHEGSTEHSIPGGWPAPWVFRVVMLVLGLAALVLEFRGRLALALVVALGLSWSPAALGATATTLRHWAQRSGLARLGQMSYSIFLIHFPVVVLVNAVVSHFWPRALVASLLGMVLAFLLSLAAGWALYRSVESRRALFSPA